MQLVKDTLIRLKSKTLFTTYRFIFKGQSDTLKIDFIVI